MYPCPVFGDVRERDLPPSPIPASGALAPLRTWAEILEKHRHHGIEFGAFLYESLAEGVCFFYRSRTPRAIVLVVLDNGQLRHIECRTSGERRAGSGGECADRG